MAYEDDDLVELQLIDEIHELANLLTLFQANIVLAKTVEGQLALLLNKHLSLVAHEFPACLLDLVR